MPTTTIPLAGNPTLRAYGDITADKDQRFSACFFEESPSPLTQEKPIYVSKRAGYASLATPATGQAGNNVFYSTSLDRVFGSFDGSGSTSDIYRSTQGGTTTSLGAATGTITHISEAIVNNATRIMFTSSDGTGWYFSSDAAGNTAYTADGNNSTTITDIKISGVNDVSGLHVGQLLTAATNIVAGSRIVSINAGAFSAVLDTATTGGAFNDLPITKTPLAKIIDTDFPTTIIGEFAQLNGYTYIMTTDGNIYNSDLNSIVSWNPASLALANSYPDVGRGVIRYKNMIAAFGSSSVEFFYHSSNATFGSPLMRSQESISNVGAKLNVSRVLYGSGHGTIFFVAEDYNFYALDGFSARKLTESPFGSQLIPAGVWPFSTERKRFVDLPNSLGLSRRFDFDTGMFTFVGGDDRYFTTGNGTCYAVVDDDTGKFYILNTSSTAVFQDNGVAYSMEIQTIPYSLNGGKGFTINEAVLLADIEASGTATLATSADDFGAFVTKGTFDMTAQKKEIHRVGYYKSNCAFRITHSANTKFRAQALVIDWEPAAT